jgi:tetratricopeptide (TPR) repeat protein
MWRRGLCAGLVVWAIASAACAPRTPPVTPGASTWRQPALPEDVWTADVASRYAEAWSAIRRGDARSGERTLTELTRTVRGFFPGDASLGEVALARRDYRAAAVSFAAALSASPRYLPALVGAVDAALGSGDDGAALTALQALLAVDPARADARSRLDAVRLRVSQSELAVAERFRAAGQWDDAERHLAAALAATPESAPALRALAAVQLARGDLDHAETRAREAVALDGQDAASFALLGDILEARGQYQDAASAYARAVAIDPRPAWQERRVRLQERAEAASLPENYRRIESAASVTRAQVAAVLGVRLRVLLAKMPLRVADVVTDVRGHWAQPWILPVVRAGWIEPRPNHTFDPGASVRRADLALIVAAVLDSASGNTRRGGLDAAFASARTTFADLPSGHVAFRAASVAVSAGIMTVDAGNRFQPAGDVSGVELLAVVARLDARTK